MLCPLCDEDVEPGDTDVRPINGVQKAHRPCLLRSGLGGYGHHLDHSFWCGVMGDPDGGLTYRESALRVDEMYASGEIVL